MWICYSVWHIKPQSILLLIHWVIPSKHLKCQDWAYMVATRSHYRFSFCTWTCSHVTWDQHFCWPDKDSRRVSHFPRVTCLVHSRGQPRILVFWYLSCALSTAMCAAVLLPDSKTLRPIAPHKPWSLVSGCPAECCALCTLPYLCGWVLLASVKMEPLGRNWNHST